MEQPDNPLLLSHFFFFFFITLVTGPRWSLNIKLSDTMVYEPQIRTRLGTAANSYELLVRDVQTLHLQPQTPNPKRVPETCAMYLTSTIEIQFGV